MPPIIDWITIFVYKPEYNPGWLDVAGEQVDPKIGLVLKSKLVFFQTMWFQLNLLDDVFKEGAETKDWLRVRWDLVESEEKSEILKVFCFPFWIPTPHPFSNQFL